MITPPTQTQIEVALRRARTILANMAMENEGAFFNRWPINHEPLRADAKAALSDIDAALTAAAQVGEQSHIVDDLELPIERSERKEIVLREEMNKAIAATIERCAQVADKWHYAADAAAAIRKLKDKA